MMVGGHPIGVPACPSIHAQRYDRSPSTLPHDEMYATSSLLHEAIQIFTNRVHMENKLILNMYVTTSHEEAPSITTYDNYELQQLRYGLHAFN